MAVKTTIGRINRRRRLAKAAIFGGALRRAKRARPGAKARALALGIGVAKARRAGTRLRRRRALRRAATLAALGTGIRRAPARASARSVRAGRAIGRSRIRRIRRLAR
jgi:hypothetical protein